jgi:hypothetical protein
VRDEHSFRKMASHVLLSLSIGTRMFFLGVACYYDFTHFDIITFLDRILFTTVMLMELTIILTQAVALLRPDYIYSLNSGLFVLNKKFGKKQRHESRIYKFYLFRF